MTPATKPRMRIVDAVARCDFVRSDDEVPYLTAGDPIPLDMFPVAVLRQLAACNAAELTEEEEDDDEGE